jgi:hypothetical protein
MHPYRTSARYLALAFALSCSASQRPPTAAEKAHIAINAAAHGLATTDQVADAAYRACTGPACLEKFQPIARAELTAYSLLLAAQAVADGCAHDAIVNALDALRNVMAALTNAGVAVPPELSGALPGLEELANAAIPTCSDGGTG